MSVLVRPTRWQDIAQLARLETQLFGADAWSEALWWGELAARPRRAYVTAESGEPVIDPATDVATDVAGGDPGERGIVGYAGIDRGGSLADVMTVAVTPRARGAGLGRQLLRSLVALAAGAEALLLEVRADNGAARALYGSEGFEVVSVRRRYYGDVDALVMRRLLTPGDKDTDEGGRS